MASDAYTNGSSFTDGSSSTTNGTSSTTNGMNGTSHHSTTNGSSAAHSTTGGPTNSLTTNGHDHSNGAEASRFPKPGDYVHINALPPGGPLNRWSQNLTREHDHPGAQVRPSFFFIYCFHRNLIVIPCTGHALCCWCPQSGHDEECPPGGHRHGVVGGQPMQVSGISLVLFYFDRRFHLSVILLTAESTHRKSQQEICLTAIHSN